MSAIAAVFRRDGGEPSQRRSAEVSAALNEFGTSMAKRCAGPAVLLRAVSAGFTPEDAGDAGIAAIGGEDGGRLLAFDGHLHHRADLIAALGRRNIRDWADSALFARAWELWGEGALQRLDGEFAALLWDPARKTLTALCSPLRAPPLYFAVNGRRAIVATAPRAIFAWGDPPRRLDDAQLAGSLVLQQVDARATYWRDVLSLAPGEALTITPTSWRIRRHYELAARVRDVRLPRDSDYIDAADELLKAAVGSAMRSVETPAILLSGGLDSTTVAVTALGLLRDRPGGAPLMSFTAVPEKAWDGRVRRGEVADEGPLVRLIKDAHPELDARFVDAAGLGHDHGLMRFIEVAEAPPRNPNNLPWILECRRLSRAAGRRTLLTGNAGNATLSFGGLPRLAALLRTGRWRTLRREAAARYGRRPLRAALKFALPPLLPAWARAKVNARWHPGFADWRSYSPIHPSFARDMQVEETARRHGRGIHYSLAGTCREQQMQLLLNPEAQGGAARSRTLAWSAIQDVAERSPLVDRRFVEWCLGLPDEQYLHLGQDRRLVRRLMRGRLPAEVLTSPLGVQGADMHLRLSRDLGRIRSTFEDWRSDPEVAGRLDLDRLLRVLGDWPNARPLSPADHPEWRLVRQGVGRALAHGRFIRWATGSGAA